MPITLALFAALTYGAADFLGGIASRRSPAGVVVVLSQLAGVVVFLASLAIVPSHFHRGDLVWGALAGVGRRDRHRSAVRRARDRAHGHHLAADRGDRGVRSGNGRSRVRRTARAAALAGIALAFVAVVLVSADPQTLRLSFEEPGLVLAIVSGLGIGLMLVALSRSAPDCGIAVLAPARVVSVRCCWCGRAAVTSRCAFRAARSP